MLWNKEAESSSVRILEGIRVMICMREDELRHFLLTCAGSVVNRVAQERLREIATNGNRDEMLLAGCNNLVRSGIVDLVQTLETMR